MQNQLSWVSCNSVRGRRRTVEETINLWCSSRSLSLKQDISFGSLERPQSHSPRDKTARNHPSLRKRFSPHPAGRRLLEVARIIVKSAVKLPVVQTQIPVCGPLITTSLWKTYIPLLVGEWLLEVANSLT